MTACSNGISPERPQPVFQEGDEVFLAEGTYEGSRGLFLRLRADVNWPEIIETAGNVRCHPMAWLTHAVDAGRPRPA